MTKTHQPLDGWTKGNRPKLKNSWPTSGKTIWGNQQGSHKSKYWADQHAAQKMEKPISTHTALQVLLIPKVVLVEKGNIQEQIIWVFPEVEQRPCLPEVLLPSKAR